MMKHRFLLSIVATVCCFGCKIEPFENVPVEVSLKYRMCSDSAGRSYHVVYQQIANTSDQSVYMFQPMILLYDADAVFDYDSFYGELGCGPGLGVYGKFSAIGYTSKIENTSQSTSCDNLMESKERPPYVPAIVDSFIFYRNHLRKLRSLDSLQLSVEKGIWMFLGPKETVWKIYFLDSLELRYSNFDSIKVRTMYPFEKDNFKKPYHSSRFPLPKTFKGYYLYADEIIIDSLVLRIKS